MGMIVFDYPLWLIPMLFVAVVIVEAVILRRLLRLKHPFVVALCVNLVSSLPGMGVPLTFFQHKILLVAIAYVITVIFEFVLVFLVARASRGERLPAGQTFTCVIAMNTVSYVVLIPLWLGLRYSSLFEEATRALQG